MKKTAKTNIFLEIFARIWAFWALALFIITFFIIYIPSILCYLIPGKKGQRLFLDIAKIWMESWLLCLGCPIKVKGQENFEPGKAYIVTSNHNALLDPPLSSPFIPGANKTIAKTSFAKIPLFGLYYRKGSVLVDRDSDASRRKSFEDMKKTLQLGMHMCIYPEGTRNRTDQPLKRFYSGAFKLAVDTQTDIIPAIILNTKKAMPVNKKFYLVPKKLEIHFLPPVSSEGLTSDQLKNKVFQIMWDYYTIHQ